MFRKIGKFIWRFMVIFSFIVNLVLIIVLLGLGLLIFEIKNNIAQPLVQGLHSSFVGLDDATIDWTIPVHDNIALDMNIPLKTRTTVVLASEIPLKVDATINLNGQVVPVNVALSLPAGTPLDVYLDLNVPVKQTVPVDLNVRAVIPLKQTQLHDVADNLRLLFEPLAVALDNLPSNFADAGKMVSDILSGNRPNLLDCQKSAYCQNPWPGYSMTAGLNYPYAQQTFPPGNVPEKTGIVPVGGIPALDQQIRPEVYQQGGPQAINAQASTQMDAQSVPKKYYDGGVIGPPQAAVSSQSVGNPTDTNGSGGDMGIIPTPASTEAPPGSGS